MSNLNLVNFYNITVSIFKIHDWTCSWTLEFVDYK